MKKTKQPTASAQFFKNDDFKYEIVEHLAMLSLQDSGWSKELNIVKWQDKSPRLDIREWNNDHSRMSKGIGLSFEEAMKLKEALDALSQETLSYIKISTY